MMKTQVVNVMQDRSIDHGINTQEYILDVNRSGIVLLQFYRAN